MNTNEIRSRLIKYVKGDIGVFAKDTLRPPRQRICAFVCNTDPHNKKGQHWIAIYIDDDGTGYFFDSYGRPPRQKEFLKFLKKYCHHWIYNDVRVQGLFSHSCGHFCLFFLIHKHRGWSMNKITKCFSKNYTKNDQIVTRFVDVLK